ncbi:MAG TPA: AsmA-like C-terminal region-containing protein, partial [Afifellaceae bacterium]|nr:AsmA-like C-terminal region-containing protein [Afifellaceae bacterium]
DTGPARLELAVEGALSGRAAVGLEAEAAGTRLHLTGEAELTEAGPVGGGDLELETSDLDPLLLLAGVALPGIGEGHALSVRGPVTVDGGDLTLDLEAASFDEAPVRGNLTLRPGERLRAGGRMEVKRLSLPLLFGTAGGQLPQRRDGAWPDETFAPALPGWIELDLALAAEEVDLGVGASARNGRLSFVFKDGTAAVDGFEAELAGGRLTGAAQMAMRDGQAALGLSAAIEEAALGELAWRGGGRPLLRGLLDASFEISGRGRSLAGLVSTMSGSGSFAVADGLVRSINPHAFSSIIRAADSGLELEREAVEAAFRGHLDAGTLLFDRASGSFSVSSGTVRFSTISVDAPSASVLGGATMDLNAMTLRSDWSLKVDPGADRVTGAEPQVGLVFAGPIADPERAIDATPLVGYLTVRAFEKEVERIENLQADILEKELFLRQHRREREERGYLRRQAEAAERRAREAAEAAEGEEEPPVEDEGAGLPAAGASSGDGARESGERQRGSSEAGRLPPLQSLSVGERPIFRDGEPLPLLPEPGSTRPGG